MNADDRKSFPPTHGRFESIGSLITRSNVGGIFDVIHEVDGERQRAGKQFWTFEQYERVFAAAQDAGKAAAFILGPLARLRLRYLKARELKMSPWQFAESERRYREGIEDREARAAAIDRDSVARSKAKAYRAMVEEAETKERARREARANVEREFGPPPSRAGRVASRSARSSKIPSALFGEREPDDDQTYIPPDLF